MEEVTEVPMPELKVSRDGLLELLKRRFFIAQSFSIYEPVGGLYDYGPPGCAVKGNLIDLWKKHFILEENMLEVDCTVLTPKEVLVTSGHVAKFQDFMVKDTKNQRCHRADHLLEDAMEELMKKEKDEKKKDEYQTVFNLADDYSRDELAAMLKKYNVKSPDGNAITEPYPFNLMFQTSIGPTGNKPGYLRPETAQSIFVNFKRLLDYNGGKLPFAAAQVGLAFRNEIAPRSGVIRVREFQMAEIEHFVKAEDKSHPKFCEVADMVLNLFPRAQQVGSKKLVKCTLKKAVASGIIGNETLAYFMARTHLFMTKCGVKLDGLRFRQHLQNEMAHYAADCWDAEVKTSYGWVECVGHADRSCFDLQRHSEESNEQLMAFERYDEPKQVEVLEIKQNAGVMGKTFRGDYKIIKKYLEALDEAGKAKLKEGVDGDGFEFSFEGKDFKLTKDMVTVDKKTESVNGYNFVPHVIEPSFGIGRIVYGILEQAYWVRDGDEQRGVLSLPAIIAPVKCSVLPLLTQPKFLDKVPSLVKKLVAAGLSYKSDVTGQAIGRKYARTDEIGIPFAITIDHETLEKGSVTLRERDSTGQVRVPEDEVAGVVLALVESRMTWDDVEKKYPSAKK